MSDHELDETDREYLAAFVAVATPSSAATSAALERARARVDAEGIDASEVGSDDERRVPWVALAVAAIALAAAVVLITGLEFGTRSLGAAGGEPPDQAGYSERDSEGEHGVAVRRSPSPAVERRRPSAVDDESRTEDGPGEPEGTELKTERDLDGTNPETEDEPDGSQMRAPERQSPARRRPNAPPPPDDSGEAPAAPVADATLHAELALLGPARKALRAGDHARALRLFDDHARSFPRSVLAEERSLGRIEALCGLGRDEQAKRAIDAFGRAHPGSPLGKRVRQACTTTDEGAP